jgi:hypothetical protein
MRAWGRYPELQMTDIARALISIDELIKDQHKKDASPHPIDSVLLVTLPKHPDIVATQNRIEVSSRSVTVRSQMDKGKLENVTTTSAGVRGTFARNMLYGHRLIVANSRLPQAMATRYMERVRNPNEGLLLSDLLDIGFPLPPLQINRITRGKSNTLFHIAMTTEPWSVMRARIKKALIGDAQ